MSQYHQILILPLIALALSILFPLFSKDLSLSNSWKSKRRRRVIRGRILVVALLLATILTELFPIDGLNTVIQGLFFTAILMIPACAIHWVLYTRHGDGRDDVANRRKRHSKKRQSEAETAHIAEILSDPADTSKTEKLSSGSRRRDEARVAADNSTAQSNTVSDSPKAPDLAVFEGNAASPDDVDENSDSPDDVKEQMARVANLVQSHDLDSQGFVAPDAEDPGEAARKSRGDKVAADAAMVPPPKPSSKLDKLSSGQISKLVASLAKDKSRLQRLVIAQQASIESERVAHDQTRTLTRDAIKVMRSARSAQKHAEKLARRERAERQRIEAQYKKVATSLRNAMSIIEKRTSAAASREPIPTLKAATVADKVLS